MASGVDSAPGYREFRKKHKRCEILFPNQFIHTRGNAHDEWKDLKSYSYPTELYNCEDNLTKIPIIGLQLCHITHIKPKKEITQSKENPMYTFKPCSKHPKYFHEDDGRAYGGSYRQTSRAQGQPTRIPDKDLVLPGFYSWWGISTQQWYSTSENGQKLKASINDISKPRQLPTDGEASTSSPYNKSPAYNVPGYLATSPSNSIYGSEGFLIKLGDILECYKTSRSQSGTSSVYFKIGGTLRYQFEICYTIVVCMEEDKLNLISMPNMKQDNQSILDLNGTIDESDTGKVCLDRLNSFVPAFKARYIVQKVEWPKEEMQTESDKDEFQMFSWENLVFAFYFPDKTRNLCCPKKRVDVVHVDHKRDKSCYHRKKAPPHLFGGQFRCRDEIDKYYN